VIVPRMAVLDVPGWGKVGVPEGVPADVRLLAL